jgi:hypothetical protein
VKKAYNKPMIEKHIFTMDIHVMSSSDRDRYNAYREDFIDIYGREPLNDAEFQEYLDLYATGDDATSGWCYFTSVTPS